MKTLILTLLLMLLSLTGISRTREGSIVLSPLLHTRSQLVIVSGNTSSKEKCPLIRIDDRSLTIRLIGSRETSRIMLKFTIEIPTQKAQVL